MVAGLRQRIAELAGEIGRPVKLMHICGTHEHEIGRFALRDLLPASVTVLAGPGCPVCVCDNEYINMAIQLSLTPGVIVTSFGDMLAVPGSIPLEGERRGDVRMSLLDARARGGDVRAVYSVFESKRIAEANPDQAGRVLLGRLRDDRRGGRGDAQARRPGQPHRHRGELLHAPGEQAAPDARRLRHRGLHPPRPRGHDHRPAGVRAARRAGSGLRVRRLRARGRDGVGRLAARTDPRPALRGQPTPTNGSSSTTATRRPRARPTRSSSSRPSGGAASPRSRRRGTSCAPRTSASAPPAASPTSSTRSRSKAPSTPRGAAARRSRSGRSAPTSAASSGSSAPPTAPTGPAW